MELIPFKTVEQKQLTFAAEEEKEIRRIVDKGLGVTSKGMGDLAAKYLRFPDRIFGIWRENEKLNIGNEKNKVIIDGNDFIINDEKYKGTEGQTRQRNICRMVD